MASGTCAQCGTPGVHVEEAKAAAEAEGMDAFIALYGVRSGEEAELKRCSRCKAVHYCSPACQVAHWKAGHKKQCAQLKSARERALALGAGEGTGTGGEGGAQPGGPSGSASSPPPPTAATPAATPAQAQAHALAQAHAAVQLPRYAHEKER